MNRAGNKLSIKVHTLVILLIVWGLLFVLITLYSRLTRETLVSEVRKTNENMLELYGEQLDSLCTEINRALSNIDITKYPASLSSAELSNLLSTYVLLYDDNFSFCFYDRINNSTLLRVASNITQEERSDILDYFGSFEELYQPGRWNVTFINSRYYLMRFYIADSGYVGSWISLDNALNLFRNNQFDKSAALYFSGEAGEILTPSSVPSQSGVYM